MNLLIAVGAGIILTAVVLWWTFRQGRQVERGREAEKGVRDASEAAKIDERVRRASDAELDRLLDRSRR